MFNEHAENISYNVDLVRGYNTWNVKVSRKYNYFIIRESEYVELITLGQLAETLKMTVYELRDVVEKTFRGSYSATYKTISFRNKENAENAREWLDSLLLLQNMTKSSF